MKLKLSLPKFNQIFFLLLLFVFIYAPPFDFIPLGINKLIAPFALIGLLFFFKSATVKILRQKHLFIGICLLITSIVYAFIMDFSTIYPTDFAFTQKNTFSQAMILIEVLPITLFLCVFGIRKLKLSLPNLLSNLVIVATVQSFMAIVMLLLPDLRMFVLTTILDYDPATDKIFRPDLYVFRSFGFSQDILFSLSIVQGIAVGCILTLCLFNFAKYKYSLFLILPLLLSIALNARIGFFAIMTLILSMLVLNLFKLRIYFLSKFILFAAITSLLIYLFIINLGFFLELDIEQNINWVSEIFVQGKNFAQGEKTNTGNFGKIQRKHLHLPESSSGRIFGEGRYVFNNTKQSVVSDTGYIRRIYFGGYIYSFLAYGALIYIFIGSQGKRQQDTFKPLLYSLILTALISQIKGDIFLPIPGFRIIFLIFLFAISERRLSPPANSRINSRFIPWYPHETRNFRP